MEGPFLLKMLRIQKGSTRNWCPLRYILPPMYKTGEMAQRHKECRFRRILVESSSQFQIAPLRTQ